MRQIRDALRLTRDNRLSLRKTAISLGISRDAVKDYLTRFDAAGLSWPLPAELDDEALELRLFPLLESPASQRMPEPDWAVVHEELKQKGATIQGLHGEYLASFPDGMAYPTFCMRYREFRKTLKRSMRQDHRAGEKVFVDYAGPTIGITDITTGEIRQAQIFVGVLGASNYICGGHGRLDSHRGGIS